MKSFFKVVGKMLLVIALLIGCLYAYEYYEGYRKDKEELSYSANREWKWHDKYNRIQIHTRKEKNKSLFRKVYLHNDQIIYAYITDDYRLHARVRFITDCEPNSTIITKEKFSDATPKKLICNEDGDSLRFDVTWGGEDTNVTWLEDLGGFDVYENFNYWDFTKLKKEVTLLKAKSIQKK